MIIIAFIITYFLGCIWYFISENFNTQKDIDDKNTWILANNLEDKNYKIVYSCYFALTTLSTVGYGDYFPISNIEMIFTVIVMMLGVAFFSYIMGNILEIVEN